MRSHLIAEQLLLRIRLLLACHRLVAPPSLLQSHAGALMIAAYLLLNAGEITQIETRSSVTNELTG